MYLDIDKVIVIFAVYKSALELKFKYENQSTDLNLTELAYHFLMEKLKAKCPKELRKQKLSKRSIWYMF